MTWLDIFMARNDAAAKYKEIYVDILHKNGDDERRFFNNTTKKGSRGLFSLCSDLLEKGYKCEEEKGAEQRYLHLTFEHPERTDYLLNKLLKTR